MSIDCDGGDDDSFDMYMALAPFPREQLWNGTGIKRLKPKTHCLIQKGVISFPANEGLGFFHKERVLHKNVQNAIGLEEAVAIEGPKKSALYKIKGEDIEGMCRTHTNGMNTPFKEGLDNVKYIQSFSPLSIHWVYNHSNGILTDLAEIASLNYAGISPLTSDLLRQVWSEFHEENKSRPYAKVLHTCHSQGALHTKNALSKLPKEIRDRVIVLAIAPATVIPKDLCYNSFNYVSTRDPISRGEILHGSFRAAFLDEADRLELLEQLVKNRKELIYLEPHPKAPWFDHAFTSPTFTDKIAMHMEEYISKKGEYRENFTH